jgi:AraC family transcriptional regulator, regulatory protein of adaptative response / methylated-DNA-[protein]-cysteine methyltransferase
MSETIRVAAGETSLGTVMVGQTVRGICAILLGDDAQALRRAIARRFPDAVLVDGAMDDVVNQVKQVVERPTRSVALTLDLRGTPFERRVWDELMKVPPGRMTTYGAIARKLGAPGTAQDIAAACARNPVAVVVPCHRVIRSDGTLAGYRWGVRRKRVLLAREAFA